MGQLVSCPVLFCPVIDLILKRSLASSILLQIIICIFLQPLVGNNFYQDYDSKMFFLKMFKSHNMPIIFPNKSEVFKSVPFHLNKNSSFFSLLRICANSAYDNLEDQIEFISCQKQLLSGGVQCNSSRWLFVRCNRLKSAIFRPPRVPLSTISTSVSHKKYSNRTYRYTIFLQKSDVKFILKSPSLRQTRSFEGATKSFAKKELERLQKSENRLGKFMAKFVVGEQSSSC